jgi:putative endopeptidase
VQSRNDGSDATPHRPAWANASGLRARVLRSVALMALLAGGVSLAAAATPAGLGFDISSADQSIRPGDDFYGFANGAWLKTTTIPAGQSVYGTSPMLVERARGQVRDLVQAAATARPGRDSVEQKVGDYYASLADPAAIEAKGLAPLRGDLDAIAAISDRTALSAYLGRGMRADISGAVQTTDGIFGLWVHQGFDDADRNYPHLLQGGLGLADRDDYLAPSSKAQAGRDRYRDHIAKVLTLAGVADPEAKAQRILAFETRIARAHASQADIADVTRTNNPWSRADFDAKAPGMDWNAWLKASGLDRQGRFIVWEPSAVTGVSALVASEDLDTWKTYLGFRLLEHDAGVLPKAFADEHAAFFETARDRPQMALDATGSDLGEEVSRLYVRRYFPPQAKARARAMVDDLIAAYRPRIANLAWMAPETKQKALKKLDALNVELGYPDKWIDYAGLEVVRGDAFGNARRLERFNYARSMALLSQPVEAKEWAIYPHTVMAAILFTPNTIDFAAAVLQPPYFDYQGDTASNYGSAGAGIAHEISHSFDELGNQYDDVGRLVSWWTPGDIERFHAASAPLALQFTGYCPLTELCLNGQRLLSENIADLTGLTIAHDAYVRSLKGRPDVVKAGLTGEQRFYLAFGQRWRKLQGEAALRRQVLTDTHAPGVFRSDTVRNQDAWYAAYAVKPGDKLYLAPAARIHIW